MYGDLKEIAGQSLEEIDGLSQIARQVEARRSAAHKPSNGGTNSRPHPLTGERRHLANSAVAANERRLSSQSEALTRDKNDTLTWGRLRQRAWPASPR